MTGPNKLLSNFVHLPHEYVHDRLDIVIFGVLTALEAMLPNERRPSALDPYIQIHLCVKNVYNLGKVSGTYWTGAMYFDMYLSGIGPLFEANAKKI